MKNLFYAAFFALALGLTGCNRDDQPPPPPTAQDAGQQLKDSANAAKDTLAKTKDEFLAAMDKEMAELDAKILRLDSNNSNASGDAQVQHDQAVAHLRAQRDAVRKRYDELKVSSQDVWEKTKADFQSGWNSLVKEYDKTVAKMHSS